MAKKPSQPRIPIKMASQTCSRFSTRARAGCWHRGVLPGTAQTSQQRQRQKAKGSHEDKQQAPAECLAYPGGQRHIPTLETGNPGAG
ncbi:hypothetical protein StoSoilB5_20590 [Arthrobacter sp. StoSoilB5]|nr:hypothetical protein StoSoilB5_20590 [Arthrobacter sp. StoSoilB5]